MATANSYTLMLNSVAKVNGGRNLASRHILASFRVSEDVASVARQTCRGIACSFINIFISILASYAARDTSHIAGVAPVAS